MLGVSNSASSQQHQHQHGIITNNNTNTNNNKNNNALYRHEITDMNRASTVRSQPVRASGDVHVSAFAAPIPCLAERVCVG